MFHYSLQFKLYSQSTLPSIYISDTGALKIPSTEQIPKKRRVFFCLGLCKALTLYELSKAITT